MYDSHVEMNDSHVEMYDSHVQMYDSHVQMYKCMNDMKIYMNDIDTYLNEGIPWPGRIFPLPSLRPPPARKTRQEMLQLLQLFAPEVMSSLEPLAQESNPGSGSS